MSQPMQQPDPLAALHPIHLPQPISWWPPAPGWWVLLFALLLLAVVAVFVWRRHRNGLHKPSLKSIINSALDEYSNVESLLSHGDRDATARLSALMRRVAVAMYPAAAGLTGDAWLIWLDDHWQRDDFCAGEGRLLMDLPYRNSVDSDVEQLGRICHDWLKAQR